MWGHSTFSPSHGAPRGGSVLRGQSRLGKIDDRKLSTISHGFRVLNSCLLNWNRGVSLVEWKLQY